MQLSRWVSRRGVGPSGPTVSTCPRTLRAAPPSSNYRGQLRRKSRGLRDLSRSPVQLRRQVVYHGPSKILHRMEDRHDCISGRSHLKCDATFFADRGNIKSNDRLTSSLIPAFGAHLRKRSSAPRYLEASLRVLCVNWRICSSRFPIENRSLRRPRGVLVQKLGEVVRPVVTEY